MDSWDLLEPMDLSSKMPADFEEQISSKKWQERKAVLDALHFLLTENPRLADSPHYREVIERVTKTLASDSNINVAASAAKCLLGFAKGMRTKFGPYAQTVMPVIFEKFKEKKALLRDPLVECADAVYASTNLNTITAIVLEALAKSNPNQKSQLDQFLYRVFRPLSAKDIPKGLLKDLIVGLSKHASDSDPEVRDSSCAALGAIMKCIGDKTLSMFLSADINGDSVKMAKIMEYRDKALSEAPPSKTESVSVVVSTHNSSVASSTPARQKAKENVPPPETTTNNVSLKPEKSQKNEETEVVAPESGTIKDEKVPNEISQKEQKEKREPSATVKRQKEETKETPDFLLTLKSDRAGRIKDEKSLRTLKWNFDSPQGEHLEQLSAALTAVTKAPFTGQLLSKDFKQHIKAIEYLQEVLAAQPEHIIANLDLLLKWSSLRFFDTNPSVLIKLLEFLLALFTQMDAMGEMLSDIEIQSFLPYLLLKSGDTKDVVRNNVRRIVRQMNSIGVPAKIFPLVLDGFKTKNSRQKAECIVIADSLIEVMGINITNSPQVTMSSLGSCIADRDSTVRNAALNAIVTVYRKIGDRVFPLIGQLGEKERAMLEERIKRSGPVDPTASSRPHTRDISTSRLNRTMNDTSGGESTSGNPQRARSASGHRRSMAVLPSNALQDGANDGTVHPGRRTHIGLSSAVSYASNLNSTFTIQQQGSGGGKFQLDPKFFQNDFDNTLTANNGREQRDSKNITLPQELSNRTNSAGVCARTVDPTVDLQPLKPVIRPTSTFSRRSESVSSISSLESAEHIDRTVHNVSCLQLNIAEEAIAQLLHLLNDPTNRQYIIDRTELILKTMVTQIFHIRSQHLEHLEGIKESDPKEGELSEFMRSICNFLTSLTKEVHLMQRISAETLRAFIDAILSLVSDQRLTTLNKQIFRSLNIVVIRLCEFTNPNVCFLALIKLAVKYQTSEPDGKMLDLIRKCLIKHNDVVADPARVAQVDILTVLEPIHAFYTRFYVQDEHQQVPESVKATAKLLCIYIQRLVVNRRYAVLNYLYPFPENSHLVGYIRRCVRAVGKKEEKSPDGGIPAMSDELVNIFKRISEDLFGGAVEDLYNFMDIHPEQNNNFEQLMTQCDYASIIRRAFSEIRQARLKREPIQSGVCVRRILPEETREFLDQQNSLYRRLDELTQLFSTPSAANTPSTTTAQSQKSSPPIS